MDMCTHHIYPKKLNFKTFLKIYFRSFLLMGSFSAKHRQNIGFAFCMEPVGKELWNNTEDYKKFMIRHIENYNCNPFMVTLILGAVAKLEEMLFCHDGVTEEDIRRFKKFAGPATGSAGDRFFWSNLRPFGIITGLILALFFGLWGVFAFLIIFNVPTFILKWHWLKAGYRLGPKVVIEIKKNQIQIAETDNGKSLEVYLSFCYSFFILLKAVILHIIFYIVRFVCFS